jgi:hypothetical protein
MGELCNVKKDWDGAEQVWVRLARLLATPEEQLAAYRRLGDLYSDHLNNLSRAEVALRVRPRIVPRATPGTQRRFRHGWPGPSPPPRTAGGLAHPTGL